MLDACTLRVLGGAGLVLAALVQGGCGESGSSTAQRYTVAQVERGRYLVNNVGFCGFCHTPTRQDGSRDPTRLLAGTDCAIDRGIPFEGGTRPVDREDGWGCLSFANLTNDASGIGERTDEEVKAAIFEGVRHDGTFVASVHPYYLYQSMAGPDRDAMVAYLRSLPPVEMTGRREAPWTSVPQVAPLLDEQLPRPVATYPELAAAQRGRYLASISACLWCHTAPYPATDPRSATDVVRRDQLLQGGRSLRALAQLGYRPGSITLNPPVSPAMWSTAAVISTNLTGDIATGLGSYSAADFARTMREGKDRNGQYSCAAAHGDSTSIASGLSDSDVSDLYHYLRSIPTVMRAQASTCEAFR